jgi:hypothetical protein
MEEYLGPKKRALALPAAARWLTFDLRSARGEASWAKKIE